MLTVETVFKSRDYMTPEQLTIANEFEQMIETEYALCCREMKRANTEAVTRNKTANIDEERAIDYSCSEIDAIHGYWYNRLFSIIKIIEHRNPQLSKELEQKYLHHEQ